MQKTWGLISGSGRSPGEGNGNPLHYWSPEKVLLWNIIKGDMKLLVYWHHIWTKHDDPPGKSIETFFFKLEDNCFTILCWPLPYININQLQVYICPLPLEPHSYLSPHPTPLSCHRALGWAPCLTQQIPICCLSRVFILKSQNNAFQNKIDEFNY